MTDNFPPESNAPATRTHEHCKAWVKAGIDVTVITCFPNFPDGKVFGGYKNKWIQKELIDGIKVIRVWSYISANKGFFKRIVDYSSFGIFAAFHGKKISADLIIATSPQFFTALAGYRLSKKRNIPWVMEVRDLWPESIAAVGSLKPSSKIYKYLERLELKLYHHASKIITVTESFKQNLINRKIPARKIAVVKNGVDLKGHANIPKNSALIKKLGLENKFIIGYIGTHGLAHGLDFVLDSVKEIKNPKIQFLFIGSGANKLTLLKKKEALSLNNVTMLDPVPKTQIVSYISIIDVALVNLKKSDTFKTVIPSKIFENAAMGKPILLGVEGESKELVEFYGAGICYEPENKNEFFAACENIYSDNSLYNKLKQGCFNLAADFDRNVLADKMLEELKDIPIHAET